MTIENKTPKETYSKTRNEKYSKMYSSTPRVAGATTRLPLSTANARTAAHTVPNAPTTMSSTLTMLALFVLASIALAFSCAPAIEVDPFASGVATSLAVNELSVRSTSFLVQWTAPTTTGIKPDGTALEPEEIIYRVYYLAGTTSQNVPSVGSIKQNSSTQIQEVTGLLQADITGLLPNTRYFVMVASYNSFTELETAAEKVIEVITPGAPGAIDVIRITNIEKTSFLVQWTAPTETGTKPDGTALEPEEIGYRIYYLAGTADQDVPSAELLTQNTDTKTQEVTGLLEKSITRLELNTRYFVTVVSYSSFAEQEIILSEVIEVITKDESTAPGAATGITIDDANVESNSFLVTWVVPRITGTKSDGTALEPEDIGYRIYYLAGTAGQDEPSAELVRQDPNVETQEVTGIVMTRITELEPNTLYFVTVASYNTLASQPAETASEEVIETTTSVVALDFEGSLSYGTETVHEFTVGLAGSIMPTSTPSIPVGASGRSIVYSLEKIDGVDFVSKPGTEAISIDANGVITINSIANDGTARYSARAEATDYTTQRVMLTITVNKADLDGDLMYGPITDDFKVGLADRIMPTSTPSKPDTDPNNVVISYSLAISSGTEFIPKPSINENGVITINSTNDGTATYTVRAEAIGYNPKETTVDIVVIKADLVGEISYPQPAYEYNVGYGPIIQPDTVPMKPSTDTSDVAISYSLTRSLGVEFDPEPSILAGNGWITVSPTNTLGTATYTVRAEAVGYNPKETTIVITILETRFVGDLTYKLTHEFGVGSDNDISPNSKPTVPEADSNNTAIRYSLTRSSMTELDPEPGIEESSGVIRVAPINAAGTATYTVRAEADGYTTQEATLTITIIENTNVSMLQVSTYYSSETTDVLPVGLGQAIEDSGTFSMSSDIAILTVPNLVDGEDYTIHFGSASGTYNGSYTKPASGSIITILKSDLTKDPSNSFSFTDGAIIAMSGSGITDTQPVATYRPSNIYTHQDLQAMRKNLAQDYILRQDIVFSPANTDTSNYETIGDDSDPFTGSLNGAEYSITGVQIVGTDTDNYQGLFGAMEGSSGSTVIAQNLVLRDFKITGNAYVGSLAGWVKRGTVDGVRVEVNSADAGKVEVSGSVESSGKNYGYGGGLVGSAGTGSTTIQVRIQNTSSAVTVSGTGAESNRIGGLVGYTRAGVEITESFATGSVTGVKTVGGLVGRNSGTLSGYATGLVKGTDDNVGGLVGLNNALVTGYATGDVRGVDSAGGLVGFNSGGTITGYATGPVIGTGDNVGGLVGSNNALVIGYATGPVKGRGNQVGGLVGRNSGGTITGYARGEVTGTSNVGGLAGQNSNGTITGYARGVVRRRSGMLFGFGKALGGNISGTLALFNSTPESRVYDGVEGTVELAITSNNSTAVTIDGTATQARFADFVFAPDLDAQGDPGKWTWAAGKWPAINIGDEVKPAAEQPIDP